MKGKAIVIILTAKDAGHDEHIYTAEIKGNQQLRAYGYTAAEAIGNLLILRQKKLGFKIIGPHGHTN
ncbi:MAG: hypothetical protein HYT65_01990 [Candidatus Yanofskybacteria bacterium]|nr:hypothetical protein [Candidatus Yanofskybacteria bacterium]